jgi:hypothetical protein
MAKEIVELSHLAESPDGPPVISRTGTNRAGAELLAARHRAGRGGKASEITMGPATFTLQGERLGVRWYETWGGRRSRELARGDVEAVNVEADDRSAAGRETWKVVLRLCGGRTLVPVRRCDRGTCEEPAAELARALGLAPALPPAATAPGELPGAAYVSMAEAGAGMRPIVDGSTTVVGAGEDGCLLIRLGDGRPWLLVGADRTAFWARAVGLPAGWDESLEVGRAWKASDVFRVYDIPGAELEERTWGRSGVPAWSGVWVEMRDGTRVRVARRLKDEAAAAVVDALGGALGLPSRWERGRAYLEDRRSEALGRVGGVSGEGAGGVGEGASSAGPGGGGGGPAVLTYARDPADAIGVIRGDGVLRVGVPPVSFWRGWIREVISLLPVVAVVGWLATVVCAARTSRLQMIGGVVPTITLLWLGAAALLSRGARAELVVADGILAVEQWRGIGGWKRQWAVEDVLDVREGGFPWGWTVIAIVRQEGAGSRRPRDEVRLLTWEGKAERRRLVEIIRAAVGLDVDRGAADGGKG